MIYTYPNREGDIFTLAIKITDKILGFQPMAIGRDSNGIYVEFEPELTPEQKTILDTFIMQIDCCQIPANTNNTTFIFTDPLECREKLRTNFGIDFDIYMTPTTYEIQFNRLLTTTEKNKLKTAFADLLKEK